MSIAEGSLGELSLYLPPLVSMVVLRATAVDLGVPGGAAPAEDALARIHPSVKPSDSVALHGHVPTSRPTSAARQHRAHW